MKKISLFYLIIMIIIVRISAGTDGPGYLIRCKGLTVYAGETRNAETALTTRHKSISKNAIISLTPTTFKSTPAMTFIKNEFYSGTVVAGLSVANQKKVKGAKSDLCIAKMCLTGDTVEYEIIFL
jgi:hypothetical protein